MSGRESVDRLRQAAARDCAEDDCDRPERLPGLVFCYVHDGGEVHECCPDCGDDPTDHTLHADGCLRIDTPAQFGPPWSSPAAAPL